MVVLLKIYYMLTPPENFTADNIRFLQNEATEWIQHANQKILEAANNGLSEAQVDITTRNPLGNKFYYAGSCLLDHFISRGFGAELCGQSYIKFSW